MTKPLFRLGPGLKRIWEATRAFFRKVENLLNRISIWVGGATIILGAGALFWAYVGFGPSETPPEPPTNTVEPPPVVPPTNTVEPPSQPPPPPPDPRLCTPGEAAEAYAILRQSIESDVGHYMRRPGEPQVMYRNCRLSGQRYEITFKMNVPGTLCDDRLRYEAFYSGPWPVDGTRVRLERIGPEFAILRRQKRELRENPWMIPTCPR